MRYALLLAPLIACNDYDPTYSPTVESLSCDTPGEEVHVAETRTVFAMRQLYEVEHATWIAADFYQTDGELVFNCPNGGAVEMLVY
jgi:hypothetical protein